ncbi:hypothetical protein [Streptomyces hygroscopicus]|uniref:hypothetical protein n=1 Tax=Streptomyces hygroscopicus TaxID=1912 RepID=UPI003F1B69C6
MGGTVAAVMLAGWIAGEVLSQAISDFNPSLGREEFISSLFNQRTYFIGDVAVGTFGGDISEELVKAGAVARCNQGATAAYVKKFLDATTSEAVPEGDFSFPIHVCYGNNLTLFDSAAIVTVNFTDWPKWSIYYQ